MIKMFLTTATVLLACVSSFSQTKKSKAFILIQKAKIAGQSNLIPTKAEIIWANARVSTAINSKFSKAICAKGSTSSR